MLAEKKVPQDLRDAVIILIYKNKGNTDDWSKYRVITLLFIADKTFDRTLLNKLVYPIAEDVLLESQCGFKTNLHGVCVRQFQEEMSRTKQRSLI